MSNNKIAPSILAADYANFASELKRIEETSAEYVHGWAICTKYQFWCRCRG